MQKSQLGLLQSMLYQILRANIGIAASLYTSRITSEPWTESELLQLLRKVVSSATTTKFCFFIDGLDEFHGRETSVLQSTEQITELIRALIISPSIKICASSRPWPEFERAFASCPRFAIQDHTLRDMKKFCRDMLLGNPIFAQLHQEDTRYQCLAERITKAADGVWLWVFLVVRDLLKDINVREDYNTLDRRFLAFPKGLESYFKFMMDRLDPLHRIQTAQIFSLVSLFPFNPIPLLALQYLDELRNPSFPLLDLKPMGSTQAKIAENGWKDRLHARCGDILRLTTREDWIMKDLPGHDHIEILQPVFIEFLHRTMFDYIKESQELSYGYLPSGWNPTNSLARLSLAMVKTQPPSGFTWFNFLLSASNMEGAGHPADSKIIAQFERSITPAVHKHCLRCLYLWQPNDDSTFPEADAFLSVLAWFKLLRELQRRLEKPARLQADGSREYLLFSVLQPHTYILSLKGVGWCEYLETLQMVLDTGANLNYELHRPDNEPQTRLMWLEFVEKAFRPHFALWQTDSMDRLVEVVKLFIQHGARLNSARAFQIELLERVFGAEISSQLVSMIDKKEALLDVLQTA